MTRSAGLPRGQPASRLLSHVKAPMPRRMLSCTPTATCGTAADKMKSHAELSRQRHLLIVVDDDRAVRNSLKFSLEIEGFSVRAYSNGDELLNGTDLAASSCLVVDYRLPGMSGLDVIEKLRERRIAVPAILITTHPSTAVKQRAAKAAIPIVEKPFLENALLDQIHAALDHGGDHD